jgi:hypothetical protein
LKFSFAGGKLCFEYESNVSFGDTKRPLLESKDE